MTATTENRRRFEGQVAIVTGAGNGIGCCIAESFAAEGASVIIAEIDTVAGERVAKKIAGEGGSATFVHMDVSDEDQVRSMVEVGLREYGQIDILVNNAGLAVHKLLVDLDLADWNRQLEVQVTGPFLTAKHVARHMIDRGGPGKIVNIASVAALLGRIKCGPHCVAKAGLTLLTKVLAMELGEYGINVNALAPGLIEVSSQESEEYLADEYRQNYLRMLPLGRIGQPSDIAKGVQFLASADSDYITGQVFVADGGLTAGHYSLRGLHDFTMLDGHN